MITNLTTLKTNLDNQTKNYQKLTHSWSKPTLTTKLDNNIGILDNVLNLCKISKRWIAHLITNMVSRDASASKKCACKVIFLLWDDARKVVQVWTMNIKPSWQKLSTFYSNLNHIYMPEVNMVLSSFFGFGSRESVKIGQIRAKILTRWMQSNAMANIWAILFLHQLPLIVFASSLPDSTQ